MNVISISVLAAGTVGLLLCASTAGVAATQSITTRITFDTPLSLVKNADINFGTVRARTASTYTITTAGVITATGSGQWLYGTKNPANITIAGSATQTVNISVGGYTANRGVTPSAATCAYNGGASGSCTIVGAAAPGTGKTLLVGVSAAANATRAAGSTSTPSFTITVVYP